jgi:hypothetical protein
MIFMLFVEIVLMAMVLYLVAGFVFAIAFVSKGIYQVDGGAHGTGFGFRLIIIPGIMVFWPMLLKKWMAKNKRTTINPDQ